MHKLNRVVQFLALAAVAFVGRPDTALAATLNFSVNNAPVQPPLLITISGPGASNSSAVTVTTTATLGTLQASAVTGTGGDWLCATTSGATLTVMVGSLCGGSTSTSQLQTNLSYNGQINVTDANGNNGSLPVTVQVGASSGGTGLVASQNPVAFSVPSGSPSQSTTVNITYFGAAQTITSVSASTNTFSSWLQATSLGTSVQITVVPTNLTSSSGSDSGTVTVVTPNGNLSIAVNLTVGGGGTTGLAASPNPLTFTVATGTGSTSLPVNITNSGSPISSTVTNISTNTGSNWLSAFSSGSTVTVTANSSILTAGSYSGTVTVSTSAGSLNFTVNLNIGSGTTSGLAASPNPLNFNLLFGSSSTSQNVAITFNGQPATITGVAASTTTGQSWLQAFSQNQGSVSVTVNPTNLSGSYSGTVTVSTTNGPITFTVNLTVGTGNTSGLVATPTAVNFNIALPGSGAPTQTVTITNNGVPVTIQSIVPNINGTWLLASNTSPGVVTLSCNCANLTMGTYSGTVMVNTSSGPITFQVNANIGQGAGSQGLAVSPSPLALTVAVGAATTTQNVAVTYNGSPVTVNSVSTTTTTGQNWLQASTTGITGSVAITVNPGFLQAGGYSGTVTINTQNGTTSLVVNLTVGSGGTSGLVVTPGTVSLTATSAGTVSPQNVTVSFNGNPVTINGVTSTTTTGQNWLTTSFTPSVPGTITINASTSGLGAGSYTGTVTVTTLQGQVSFQVTLSVGGGVTGNGLVVSPNPIAFTESTPGTATPQFVSVTLNGAPQAILTTTFTPAQLGLTFVNTVVNPDGTATLTVNNVVTTQGTYTGSLTIYLTSGGSAVVPVTLTFGTGGGGTGGLAASPNPVNFSIPAGGAASTQNVSITSNGALVTVSNVSTSTTSSLNWLQAATTSSLGGITVTANPFGLGSGSYTGTVLVTTTSGSISIPVNLTVGGSGQASITLSTTSLSFAYQTGQAQPPSQSVTLTAAGGSQIPFTATATTSATPSWLTITPTSGTVGTGIAPASITASVNAAGLAAGTYTGTIAVTPTGGSPQTVTVTLTVTAPVVTAPAVAAVQNAASSVPTAVSPGLNILIFGTNMGPATLTPYVIGANGALATTVAGTQVTFDGVAAPIIYTRNTLVSVMVPYGVAGRVSTSMVVIYNGVSSTALQLRVVDTAPGIYTLTQTGSGQGAILNQDGSVNGASNTEAVGNYIQIFGTGEGQTSPAGVDGAILPSRLPLPVPNAAVTVTIGGVPVSAADINYAGEAPGEVSGVFQVNAKIPPGVGPGAVPVVVQIGGVNSQANVTVSVR